jgi:hypothetical protein
MDFMTMTMEQPKADAFRAPKALFWTALIVRVAFITLAHSYRARAFDFHFEFGWETGRVAASLASGLGYSSPFSGNTGPTAWMVPGYTLLMAGVFKLFGIYTKLSAWTILVLNSVAQSLAAPAVYEIGARTADRRTGWWAGWLWALYPGIMQYSVKWIWETSISASLFTAVLLIGLRMRGTGEAAVPPQRARMWAIFGLLWGAIAMINPTLILFAPIEGIWILMALPNRKAIMRGVRLALLSTVVGIGVASPWVIRNALVFHAFIPTRDNLGAEEAEAWFPAANGFPWGATVDIVEASPQHQLYARMGELEYVQMRGELAHKWAKEYPEHFWKLVGLRAYMYWGGVPHGDGKSAAGEWIREGTYCLGSITGILGLIVALRRKMPAAGLFALAIVLLPIVYYFVTVGSRFRHPLEPMLLILSVYLFRQAEPRWGFSFGPLSSGSRSAKHAQ